MSERSIFLAALDIDDPAQRAAYVDAACAGDAALRGQVEQLLAAHDEPAGFMERPAPALITTAAEGPHAEGPGAVIGPYKLLEVIGEGGFGVVYMAEQQRPVRRKVALKVLKPGMDTRQVVARFEAERQALALMDHPNIAHVFDGGTTPSGRPYFVMELVKGAPVTQYCDLNRLTPRQRLKLFIHVCQAVQHAHQKGVIHRDLKPSNVLVTLHDVTPVVKVIDFGVAKAMGQVLTDKTLFTGFAQLIGTPLYMSPEQAGRSGLDVDTRGDIYSLGVLLYELLTGTTPFPEERFREAGYDEIRRIIREEEPPRPSTRLSASRDTLPAVSAQRGTEPAKLAKLVKGELDWVVMKCLEKDRNRRYESAAGLAADVQRYLNDEQVFACPPSTVYLLKKFLKRNKGPALAAALVLLAVLCGIAGVVWGLVEARRQRDVARDALAAEKDAKEIVEAVLDFVDNKVFAAARPEGQDGGLGKDVTLREAVEQALPYVETSFPDRPLIEARLRMTIGHSFRLFGDPRARAQFGRARDILTAHYGPDHPETLKSLEGLSYANGLLGNNDEYAKLAEELVRRRKATLGPDHLDTLRSMTLLANSYQTLLRHADAMTIRVEVLQRLKANYPDEVATLSAMGNLAESHRIHGRYEEALQLNEEAVRLRRLKQGAEHPETLLHSTLLAGDYMWTGRWPEALQLLKDVNSLQTAKLGPDHMYTLSSLGKLAGFYSMVGQEEEALRLREEVVRRQKSRYGLDHVRTPRVMHELARSYFITGRHADALTLREEALRLRKAKYGPDHADTLESAWAVAESLTALDRDGEATPLVDDCLKRVAGKSVSPWLVPDLFLLRLRLHAKKNDVANCLATAQRLDERKASDMYSLLISACCRGRCAAVIRKANMNVAEADQRAKEQADLAVARLTRAIDAGFKEPAWIKREKDLDPLRERPDFANLVAELEARYKWPTNNEPQRE